MKKLSLLILIFTRIFSYSQITDNFSDGNFDKNPTWLSETGNWTINSSLQLQSNALSSSSSSIFTKSYSIDDATWECQVKINYNPSSYNYACIYIISDKTDVSSTWNGYYVQIGNSNDEISLYCQKGNQKTKIIDGIDKRTNKTVNDLYVRVSRDKLGNFKLQTRFSDETEFTTEGEVQDNQITESSYFGLGFSNTTSTGNAYIFDNISVIGNKAIDITNPLWTELKIAPNQLTLTFNEKIRCQNSQIYLNEILLASQDWKVNTDSNTICINLLEHLEKGKIYNLKLENITDQASNILVENTKKFGICESIEPGDIKINEVMFEQPTESSEYIEIINTSSKILRQEDIYITTRKSDGSYNTANSVLEKAYFFPGDYLCLTENAALVKEYFQLEKTANIQTIKWNTLNNEKASIVVLNNGLDTIFDELSYDTKWHNPIIKDPKGVALERIDCNTETQNASNWHSAASTSKYGSPCAQNTQSIHIEFDETKSKKWAWAEPASFSPDNDGIEDLGIIKYQLETNGYIGNISILSPRGELIIKLVNQSLLNKDGYICWDGKNTGNLIVNPGIYVIYFEIFNSLNGLKKSIKFPIVVSSR